MTEIELRIESEDIVPNRRLRATWSYEAMQDLESVHNVNSEQALTEVLAREINEEIDRELMRDYQALFSTRLENDNIFSLIPSAESRRRLATKVDWKKEGF